MSRYASTLAELKTILEENDDEYRMLSDERLKSMLIMEKGDLNRAVYLGALAKAQEDGISLPDGVSLPSSRDYWLRIAQMYRPNHGGPIPRADGR